eukprot:459200-Prymnesium_polylepis.1
MGEPSGSARPGTPPGTPLGGGGRPGTPLGGARPGTPLGWSMREEPTPTPGGSFDRISWRQFDRMLRSRPLLVEQMLTRLGLDVNRAV